MKMRRRRLLLPKPLTPAQRIQRLQREMYRVALDFVRRLPLHPLALRNRPLPEPSGPTVKFRPGPWATHQFSIDPPEVARAKNLFYRNLLDNLAPPPKD